MNLKKESGITLISLTITIIILLLITSAIIYNSTNATTVKKLNNLYLDIEAINSKVDEYYLKYNELPILCEYLGKEQLTNLLNTKANAKNATLNGDLKGNDSDVYYVIDLEKLDGLSLNYGYDNEYKKIKENPEIIKKELEEETEVEDEIYIINEKTHQVYFPHGIVVDGYMHFYMD